MTTEPLNMPSDTSLIGIPERGDVPTLENIWIGINNLTFEWFFVNVLVLLYVLPTVYDGIVLLFALLCMLTFDRFNVGFGCGDSMRPSIPRGSTLCFRYGSGEDVSVGDIVCFETSISNSTVSHRIIDETDTGYVAQGDGTEIPDLITVEPDMILGKVASVGYQPLYIPLSPTAYFGLLKTILLYIAGRRPARESALEIID